MPLACPAKTTFTSHMYTLLLQYPSFILTPFPRVGDRPSSRRGAVPMGMGAWPVGAHFRAAARGAPGAAW